MLHTMKILPTNFVFVFFCMIVMATSLHASAKIQSSEANALLKWKESFDNQSKALLSSWFGNKPCNWMGITCDVESKSIYNLHLANIGLKDTLQSLNISSLPKIQSLVLRNSSFYGVVPHHIGRLSNLNTLERWYPFEKKKLNACGHEKKIFG